MQMILIMVSSQNKRVCPSLFPPNFFEYKNPANPFQLVNCTDYKSFTFFPTSLSFGQFPCLEFIHRTVVAKSNIELKLLFGKLYWLFFKLFTLIPRLALANKTIGQCMAPSLVLAWFTKAIIDSQKFQVAQNL